MREWVTNIFYQRNEVGVRSGNGKPVAVVGSSLVRSEGR